MTDDDDIQEYVNARQFNERIFRINELARNAALEEVALEIDKMKVFEADTMASIAAFIRDLKR